MNQGSFAPAGQMEAPFSSWHGSQRLVVALVVGLAASGAAAQSEQQVEALRERVRGLEISLATSGGQVSTRAASEAGAAARPGAGDAARVKELLALVVARKGAELSSGLGVLLAQGERAHPTLHDFCVELDRDSRQANLLTYSYYLSFSLAHLAALYPDELARFSHFYLTASQGSPRSSLRRTIFDFVPDFLRYYRGRYPDLQGALEGEILTRLQEGKGNLQMYYSAMSSLGYQPPLDVFDKLLESAASHAEILPVARHLEAVNSEAAVAILTRNVLKVPPGLEWKAGLILSSLVRMTGPAAEKAQRRLLHSGEDHIRGPALQAYFTLPRDETDLPLLLDFLGSEATLDQKRLVVMRLAHANQGLLAKLRAERAQLPSAEVRALLDDARVRPRKEP